MILDDIEVDSLFEKTPVVLFIFKRSETLPAIIEKIREYSPHKIYLLADGPRDEEERYLVEKTRSLALELIDWKCDIIKNFSEENIGVYKNIGEKAKWVFQFEDQAIFLEDDNLPETTFFEYCDHLLKKYKDIDDVLWICGTNYLGNTQSFSNFDYYYTRNLLPCGWASWSSKFESSYDGELKSLNDTAISKMSETYIDKKLFHQELQTVKQTRFNYLRDPRLVSWDRQMVFSVRSSHKYGIAPALNQIKNIGADELSTHGGTSTNKIMTSRFCEITTQPLKFPLASPTVLKIDVPFESAIEQLILYPVSGRILRHFGRMAKSILGIDPDDSLALILKNRRIKKNKNV